MTDNVLQLPVVNLRDIPARLRKLADDIEAGHYGIRPSAMVILPEVGGGYPMVFGYGDVEGNNQPIVQLALAQHWFLSHSVRRD